MRTETTVRHTKCGRMRGMVVGEGGRSSGVLLYLYTAITFFLVTDYLLSLFTLCNCDRISEFFQYTLYVYIYFHYPGFHHSII